MLRAALVYVFVPFDITILLSAETLLVVLPHGVPFSEVAVTDLGLLTYSSTGFIRPDVGFVTLDP